MKLIPEIVENHAEMARWRRDIHKHPEMSLNELRTASKIAEQLRSFGFDEVIEKTGYSSVIGVLKNGEGPMIGFVAAIDAQDVQEVNEDLIYRSVNDGCMHALGHDGEVAMLLGAAKYFAQKRSFKGSLVFIFYSGFIGGLSARSLIEDGLFERFPVIDLFAFQSMPKLMAGKFAISAGAVMGGVAELLIKLTGRGGHAAFPNHSKNPILAAASIITSLGLLVSSRIDPANPLLIATTSIQSGHSFRYTPDIAELRASVRFIDPDIESWLPTHTDMLVTKIAEAHRVDSMISYRKVCAPTVNDPALARYVRDVAQDMFDYAYVQEIQPPTLIGSDISYFYNERPGVCIGIGNAGDCELMDPCYDFNDEILPIGASLLVYIAQRILSETQSLREEK